MDAGPPSTSDGPTRLPDARRAAASPSRQPSAESLPRSSQHDVADVTMEEGISDDDVVVEVRDPLEPSEQPRDDSDDDDAEPEWDSGEEDEGERSALLDAWASSGCRTPPVPVPLDPQDFPDPRTYYSPREYKGRNTLYPAAGIPSPPESDEDVVEELENLSGLTTDLCEDAVRHILSFLPARELFLLPHFAPRDVAALAVSPHLWKDHLDDLRGFYREVVVELRRGGQARTCLGWVPRTSESMRGYSKRIAEEALQMGWGSATFPTFEAIGRAVDKDDEVSEVFPDRIKWAVLQYAPLRARNAVLAQMARHQKDGFRLKTAPSRPRCACEIYHGVFLGVIPVMALVLVFLSMCFIVASEAIGSTAPQALMIVATVFASLSVVACVCSICTLAVVDEMIGTCLAARRIRRLDRLTRLVPDSLLNAHITTDYSMAVGIRQVHYNRNPWAAFIPMTIFPFVACLSIPTAVVTICLAHWIGVYSLAFILPMFAVSIVFLVVVSLWNNSFPTIRPDRGAMNIGRIFPFLVLFVVTPWWIFSVLGITLGLVRDNYLSDSAAETLDYVVGSLSAIAVAAAVIWLCIGLLLQVCHQWDSCFLATDKLKEKTSCSITLTASIGNPFAYSWFFIPSSVFYFARSYRWIGAIVSLPLPIGGLIGWIIIFCYLNRTQDADYLIL